MFLYETHLHTSCASACASARGVDYLQTYRDLGYAGIFVTEHFYNGNTRINPGLSWKKWVDEFCRGYEECREAGARIGLAVFFGWEETFQGDDYLVYGPDRAWLLEHPEARTWSRKDQYEAVRAAGGCVVQAHPFRAAPYLRVIHLAPFLADAVEIANGGNLPEWDALAARYAEQFGLPATAGSDIHHTEYLNDDTLMGVYLEKKLESEKDYVRAVKEHRIAALKIPEGRRFEGEAVPALPVDIRDGNDRSPPWRGDR